MPNKEKYYLILLVLLAISMLPNFAHAKTDILVDKETAKSFEKINQLLTSKGLSVENSGFVIADIEAASKGEKAEIFSLNPEKMLKTASVMKLFTSAAALYYLKPEYQFVTSLLADHELKSGKLTGNIYLKADADPFFVPEQMEAFIRQIRVKGVKSIRGTLNLDLTCHDDLAHPKGWLEEKFVHSYAAKISPLSYSFNSVAVHIVASGQLGEKPEIRLDPDVSYLRVKNQARIIGKGRRNIEVSLEKKAGYELLTITGNIVSGKEYLKFVPVLSPEEYFAKAFIKGLEGVGINFKGKIKIAKTPKDAIEIVEHKSLPLSVIIRSLNLYSSNLMAELILRQTGASFADFPGTTQKGIEAVSMMLKDFGLDEKQLAQKDGSGLTPDSLATASLVTKLLIKMYGRFDIGFEYVASLSSVGGEGTLRKHLTEDGYYRQVRAKTGFIDSVMSVAGYVKSKNGKVYAFCILLNEVESPYRQTWDNILDEILKIIVDL